MRLVLALALALPVAGCSLIYNPNNIDTPPADGALPDVEVVVDADPTSLSLEVVRPATIIEGQGIDGSREAVLVIHGENFVEGATVELVDTAATGVLTSVTVDNTRVAIAANHKVIVVPVKIDIAANDANVIVDLKITQMANGVMVEKTLPQAVTIRGLPDLTGVNVPFATGSTPRLFSRVAVQTLMITGTDRVIVRSMSSLSITGLTSVNATTTAAGPGGGAGGSAGPMGTVGGKGGGTCGGLGGAGTDVLFPGDPGQPGMLGANCNADSGVTDFTLNVSGGGGGGGGGGLGAGGAGGPGGGTVELTAAGTLAVGAITASGSAAVTANGKATGGPGSGGVILLRAGGTLAAGALTAAGGGTTGGVGRIRVDSPAPTLSATPMPEAYRGPSFDPTTPLIALTPTPQLKIVGQPGTAIKLYIDGFNNEGDAASKVISTTVGPDGTNTFTLSGSDGLFRGTNNLCLEVAGALSLRDEARNCLQMAYVMQAGQ